MKKHSLLKVLGITSLVFVLLTWLVKTGSYSSGVYTEGELMPLGLFDILIYPFHSVYLSMAFLVGIVILLIGGLYGVLNATGVYTKLVKDITKKFEGKEKILLIISISVFAILSSLTTLSLPLFILVPFVVAIIMSLGYEKMTAFLSTVGAILVGRIGVTYGNNYDGYNYMSNFFNLSTNSNILIKFILLILVTGVLIFFVLKTCKLTENTKKASKKENLEIPLYENVENEKKKSPLIIILLAMMIFIIVAMYNWEGAFNIQLFNNIHTSITEFEIGGFAIFAKLLGSINPIGYWTNFELAILLFINIWIIGWVYNLKCSTIFESFIEGAKKMLSVAIISFLATIIISTLFAQLYNLSQETIFPTIQNFLYTLFKTPGDIILSIVTFIGSLLFCELPYLLNVSYDPITALYTNLADAAVNVEAIYGFAMMIFPTSVILLIGLKFMNISYGEWFKRVWKLLLGLLLVIILVLYIIMPLI